MLVLRRRSVWAPMLRGIESEMIPINACHNFICIIIILTVKVESRS